MRRPTTAGMLNKGYRGEARKDVIDIERKPNHRMVLMIRLPESLVPNKADGR